MPNRHGDLNIGEAAQYLGVSESIMRLLYAAPNGPLFLLGGTKQMRAEGPWFAVADLDRFRPRMSSVIAKLPPLSGTIVGAAGKAKSVPFRV